MPGFHSVTLFEGKPYAEKFFLRKINPLTAHIFSILEAVDGSANASHGRQRKELLEANSGQRTTLLE
jgi:hypothetical protein